MPKVLSEQDVRFFNEQGFLPAIRAVSETDAGGCRRSLEVYEADTGKSAVETIHISWHQDHAYFGLKPPTIITAWLALNEVTRHNGCMRVVPGSHQSGTQKHVETYDKDNLLSRGQALTDVDDSKAVDIVLKPGEFSLHHGHLFHSSEPNVSDDRRIGFAMMFIPAHVESTIGRRGATLINGEDRYGHWDHDPRPTRDRDPVIWDLMHQADRHYRDRAHTQDTAPAGAK
jgi:non-heme Fe2+,alpha-ketoglutarate-dependent halogenase